MAGKGHATGDLADLRGIELGHIDWPSQLCFGFFEDETDDGIGATERLEAAEPQPLSFVLQMNRGNAGFGRESRQGDERRLGMLVAIAEVAFHARRRVRAEDRGMRRFERQPIIRVAVGDEHEDLACCLPETYCEAHVQGAEIRASFCKFVSGVTMPPPNAPQLDAFDRQILEILQRDNTTPQRTIGEAVNLSAPAVQRRIKRMTEQGVIRANIAVIDPAAVGQAITIFVEVELISETAEQIEQAKREFAAAPEIQQCYYVTGEADFVLVIVVPSMADYEALTRRLFFGNNNVKRFRTFVAMDRIKVGLSVPT
ncbi:Transcriptional regulator, AsnC family [Sinorhizobium sp. CCBAU 05631]|nr:Transcriptional regulator, AsnC family [Sinorhizobium sp. CCBAU 05631]